jgi:transcriptional regulator with XRE-family HTH domain
MNDQSKSPSEILSDQLAYFRERSGLSQQQLADKLVEMGVKSSRATIARTEAGEREVGLDEALQLAAALDLSPSSLFLPFVEGPVAIAPELVIPSRRARNWLRRAKPLSGPDGRYYETEASDEEWIVLQNNQIRHMARQMQQMLDAMLAKDGDAMARLADMMNDELTRYAESEKRGQP